MPSKANCAAKAPSAHFPGPSHPGWSGQNSHFLPGDSDSGEKTKKLSGNDSSLKMVQEEVFTQMLQQRDPSDARNPHEDQES